MPHSPAFPQCGEGGTEMLLEHDTNSRLNGHQQEQLWTGWEEPAMLPFCFSSDMITTPGPVTAQSIPHLLLPPRSCPNAAVRAGGDGGHLEVSKEWSERVIRSQRDNGQKALHRNQGDLKINSQHLLWLFYIVLHDAVNDAWTQSCIAGSKSKQWWHLTIEKL